MKTFCQILFIIIGLMTTHSSVLAQESVERSLDNFEKLRITGKIDAKLVPGEENKIYLESEDDVELSKISTEIKKGKLTVKLKSSLFKSHSAVARITYTSLKSIEALADANITFADPLKQDTLNLEASSGAKITL
ncbi:MAG: GIN domain-containing protein, partial [Bacteroidales bacterium]